MKFVILLLAFFIPLLTSTLGELMCYRCNTETEPDCITLKEVKGDKCTKPGHKYCMTLFSDDGKVSTRRCTYGEPTESTFNGLNYVEKTGCQNLKDKADKIKLRLCLCNTDNCNGADTKPLPDSAGDDGNKSKSNTCKIVGMSQTTLLGGVLALLLIK